MGNAANNQTGDSVNRTERLFLENIRKQHLAARNDKVLLAVSGGPDSMALLHLFLAVSPVLGCACGVAHCNFNLRGEESDRDEAFVRDACRVAGIDCHVRRFDTASVASAWKKSIEESARILRYDYFAELGDAYGYSLVATGHHTGDNAETLLFNLIRGTSVSGLRGIRARQGSIIRPLLPFSRRQLLDYLEEKKISWRTDRSNECIDYDRNFIRNKVIPVIEERFVHKLSPSLQRMSEHAGELEEFIERHAERLVQQHSGLDISGGKLHIATLRQLTLFERKELFKRVLRSLGRPAEAQVLDRIAALIDSQSGRIVQIGGGMEVVRKEGFLRFRRAGAPTG